MNKEIFCYEEDCKAVEEAVKKYASSFSFSGGNDE